jgi:polysaccharide export outer membrane protein
MARFAMKALLALVMFCLVGCVESRTSDPGAEGPKGVFRAATTMDVSATEYRVAPPDKLVIHASGIEKLDGVTVTIRPDGKILLNLVGELYVAGKTPTEIGKELSVAAERYYNGPTVQVDVAEYNSKFYEVFGTAVREPGRKAYTGRNTVIAALCEAGFNQDSWPQQVHVSRPPKEGRSHVTAIIDMTSVYLCGDTSQNYLLEEGDIIFVPDSPLKVWEKGAKKLLDPFTGGAGAVSAAQTAAPGAKRQ